MLPVNKAAKNVYTVLPSDYTVRLFVDQCYNVYEVLLGTEIQPFIIKTYSLKKHAEAEVENLLKLFYVDGVPKLLDYNVTDDFCFTIMTRVIGQDLLEYCKKNSLFRERTIKPLVRQLCTILLNVLNVKIIHSDLKPENMIYDHTTGKVCLIDFESDDKKTNTYNTPEYLKNSIICEKTISWQLGVTIYYLLSGKFPFKNQKEICDSEPIMSIMWSDDLQDFLQCLLEKDRKVRYSIKEIMSHEWLCE